jgi:hypothetical protein
MISYPTIKVTGKSGYSRFISDIRIAESAAAQTTQVTGCCNQDNFFP